MSKRNLPVRTGTGALNDIQSHEKILVSYSLMPWAIDPTDNTEKREILKFRATASDHITEHRFQRVNLLLRMHRRVKANPLTFRHLLLHPRAREILAKLLNIRINTKMEGRFIP